jgi:predicted amidohydrolase YtcJ
MTPTEALHAATRLGGQVMMRGQELGMVRSGFLADILLIDGNPLHDLSILVDPARITLVMKDGVIHKEDPWQAPRDAALHLDPEERPLQDEGVRLASTAVAH